MRLGPDTSLPASVPAQWKNYFESLQGAGDVPHSAVLAAVQAQAQRFEAHLTSSLAGAGFNASTSSDRYTLSLDLMAGRKRLYHQEPRFYLFPGLPQEDD